MRVSPGRRVGLSVLAAVATWLLVGGWAGAIAGVVVGGALLRWYGRIVSVRPSLEERQVAAELPFACDLLAAALRAGASPDLAARSVGGVLEGPLGQRLVRVDRALRLGAPAEEAWTYLGSTEATLRVVQAAVRSQHSGAAFAGSLQRVADDLRADSLIATEAAARRAGVLIVLPLGLCFLPAFVLAGLVPVIAAVLGGVLSP
jgi:pilus assembly protein TadC